MCGIIGYIGDKEKKSIILEGLKDLEYRGYDSAGLSVLKDNELIVYKAVGKLSNLEQKAKDFHSEGFGVAIGHTRWATHGKPTELNAHPHTAGFSNVVHNGIIENYAELKEDLIKKGHGFVSQTDTEVIVHLFEENLKLHDPMVAFIKTIKELKGAYAILLITKASPDSIFYAKNASPLVIGEGREDDIYFASSDSPLIGKVDRVVYLQDGDIGEMKLGGFGSLKDIKPLSGSKESSQKEGFRFYMEKEIYEQEKVLLECMLGRVGEDSINLEEIDSKLLEGIDSIRICACGTSYHAGLVGQYLIERKARIKASTEIASEFRYAKPIVCKNELFVVISQSGETADTLEALKLAKDKGLKTLSICNVDNSSIVRLSDACLLTRAGIEKGVASTKAFATQVMVLWMLSVYLGLKKGNIDKKGLKSEIKAMLGCIKATHVESKMHERLKRLSKRYLHGHGFFFIGRDVFYPLALEGALKLKEISYLHAQGYPSGEMKHGPIALADSLLFTLALIPKNLLYDKVKSNVEELAARDSTICALSPLEFELADDLVLIPQFKSYMEEFFSMMVCLQLLALEIAVRLGNDVDMPRNLAKSVTVE
ncbi:glutamine--fructose-6-phosphate aminotransferase [Helicobacter sp. 13S00401-1]|uniref:glutamine--fructose-6-phosphate transaminase (isomerizing) n=1 Tax=Helicobacter sp. 13S00401-1 TaxID=1905758 RepID=UPI000BA77EB8|nr:glutamine--fructose-6-phosphate transaminase (isomerizing) [Helicobacter sp. 13S00401-1]PAF51174.1 glutamine--fructose-6-phosphate aminotransferase [Helicobacter sp. 13S00401-1]